MINLLNAHKPVIFSKLSTLINILFISLILSAVLCVENFFIDQKIFEWCEVTSLKGKVTFSGCEWLSALKTSSDSYTEGPAKPDIVCAPLAYSPASGKTTGSALLLFSKS